MITCVILLVSLCFVNGFLLDTTNQQTSGGHNNAPYLSVSEFVDAQKEQQRDLDRKFALLSSQIQQKFVSLENKINELEKNNDTVQTANNWKQKFHDLEKKYTNTQTNFQTLKAENILLKAEYSVLKNETVVLKAEITTLKKLGNINPLQDILTLQQKVQSIETKTNSLSINKQARNQDFIALYNETLISKQKLSDLKIQTDDRINKLQTNQTQGLGKLKHELDIKISTLDNNTNDRMTILQIYQKQKLMKIESKFEHEIEDIKKFQNETTDILNTKIHDFIKEENQTLTALQKKVASNSERVAFTGCAPLSTKITKGDIIRFSDVKDQVGIQHLSDLKNSGKFTCEREGLYQIAASITSDTNGARYFIYKNGAIVAHRYLSFTGGGAHATSAIIALELNVSDTLWVQTAYSMDVYGDRTCFIIIKVK